MATTSSSQAVSLGFEQVQNGPEGKHVPVAPSAPPGYENATFEDMPLPPPPYTENDGREQSPQNILPRLPALTEEEVRDALVQFVDSTCCYGKKPLSTMVLRDIRMKSAFHLTLETFTESRETKWQSEPYTGQAIVVSGPIPRPWDVYLPPAVPFVKNKAKIEVPNTAQFQGCAVCARSGVIRCHSCQGSGRDTCAFCNGSMRHFDDRCRHCTNGHKMCSFCGGSGRRTCHSCRGSGQMKYYLELKVTWCNHADEAFSNETGLPPTLIKKVAGQQVINDTQSRVHPLINFPDSNIEVSSKELVAKHAASFPMERILKQRQILKMIPVTLVAYDDQAAPGTFQVYGFERKVHFPNYPNKCCCCSIL